VPGAPDGRYARADGACGIGEDDLDALADALGAATDDERRLLLSWAAPAGTDAALGMEGGDAGSAEISAFADAIGAEGGLFAWPESQAGRVAGEGAGRAAVAPAIAGPAVVRADGSPAPSGLLFVRLGPEGVQALSDAP
jgi:hypothetical protein